MTTTLLTATAGGHLKQLFTLAPRLGIAPEDQLWVTQDSGLSRSLLEGREVIFSPYVKPRDPLGVLRDARLARSIFAERDIESAISTGASLALSFLPVAARSGVTAHYIESAARADGPSMSGKLMALDKRVHTYTQYPVWADERWRYRGSIFDAYEPGPQRPAFAPRSALVTIGTTESYGFRRLFEALVPLLAGMDVLWQVGATDVSDLGIDGRERIPHDEMRQAVADADVIITHSGTGSALTAMDAGKHPVLVPRIKAHGEHIDDHQLEIADELDRRGLATRRLVEDLDLDTLARAAGSSVSLRTEVPPLLLDGVPAPA